MQLCSTARQTWYLPNHVRDHSFGGKNFTQKQASKPRSYASSKLRPTDWLTHVLTWVKCRATSVAKNELRMDVPAQSLPAIDTPAQGKLSHQPGMLSSTVSTCQRHIAHRPPCSSNSNANSVLQPLYIGNIFYLGSIVVPKPLPTSGSGDLSPKLGEEACAPLWFKTSMLLPLFTPGSVTQSWWTLRPNHWCSPSLIRQPCPPSSFLFIQGWRNVSISEPKCVFSGPISMWPNQWRLFIIVC